MNHNIRNEIKSIIVREGLTMDEVVNNLGTLRLEQKRPQLLRQAEPLLSALHGGSGAGRFAGL